MKVFRVLFLAGITFCSLAMYSCSDPYEEIKVQDKVEAETEPHSNGEEIDP